ncbi:Tn7-like element transposition protein TnsE [Methyloglobulus sp.]|uniref:Tn7-like element transposition protein TnsE n=1 Tax=Methyloglobulus sp. TaxID=2518622 RepID=UPI0032B7F274
MLNQTIPVLPAGYQVNFSIKNTQDWVVCKLSDCPILSENQRRMAEANELCFNFKTDNGYSIYLPQFELARALFFHDAYMARTAMDSEVLKTEFDIVHDQANDAVSVNVSISSSYRLKSFENIAARNILSWILVDPDARASFESIVKYEKQYAIELNDYRNWSFQFDPPKLKNANFIVRGKFDKVSACLLVFEVVAVKNLSHNLPKEVKIFHPKFKEYVRGQGGGGYVATDDLPDEYDLHDGEEANLDSQHIVLAAPDVEFEFVHPFKTSRVYNKKQNSPGGRKDEETGNQPSKDVSSEESSITGELPQADWDTAADSSDDIHLYASKFDCFQQMLELLKTKHDCIIVSTQIRKLPKLPRCNMHLLKTEDSPRCIATANIQYKSQSVHLLEVDTSDAAKSLSTLLIVVKEPRMWPLQLEELEMQLVKRSLRWPSRYLNKISLDKKHQGIPHPRTSSANKGLLDPDSITKWASRVQTWISQI